MMPPKIVSIEISHEQWLDLKRVSDLDARSVRQQAKSIVTSAVRDRIAGMKENG